jgi:hypothetical protein
MRIFELKGKMPSSYRKTPNKYINKNSCRMAGVNSSSLGVGQSLPRTGFLCLFITTSPFLLSSSIIVFGSSHCGPYFDIKGLKPSRCSSPPAAPVVPPANNQNKDDRKQTSLEQVTTSFERRSGHISVWYSIIGGAAIFGPCSGANLYRESSCSELTPHPHPHPPPPTWIKIYMSFSN